MAINGTKRQSGAYGGVTISITKELEEKGYKPLQEIKLKNLLPLEGEQSRTKVLGYGLFDYEFAEDYYVYDKLGRVLRIPATDDFRELYEVDLGWKETHKRIKYVVPLAGLEPADKPKNNLKLVKKEEEPEVEQEDESIDIPEDLPDLPKSNMTLRQYACIHLGVPATGLAWLDDIIMKSPR